MSYITNFNQNVQIDANNGSTTNIAGGASFVGLAASTLGVAAVQISLKTDQNCHVYVDQSIGILSGIGTSVATSGAGLTGTLTHFTRDFRVGDQIWVGTQTVRTITVITSDTALTVNTAFDADASGLSFTQHFWDITDEYEYFASINNFGITVKAINSYVRIRVTNDSAITTTYFRLQTALCPITESLPRSLDEDGNLQVAVKSISDEYGWSVENTPTDEMRAIEPVRLVGSNFDLSGNAGAVDSNFWTASIANSGTVVQATGEVTLSTTTTAQNGTARLHSFRRARYVSGSALVFRAVVELSAGATNNKRRWGVGYGATMPTITDGAWFQLDGTGLSINTQFNNGTPTKVTSFNGRLGGTYTLGITSNTFEIYWTNSKVYFTVNGEVLHTVTAGTDPWSATMSPYIYMDNVNSSNLQTNHTLKCRVASIRRLGGLLTQATSYFHALGQTTGVTLKHSAGNLHKLVINSLANNAVVTLSDSTSTTTPVIWAYTATAAIQALNTLDFGGIPFFNGLRLTVSAGNASLLVVYE